MIGSTDDLDAKIFKILEDDGRRTFSSIATALRISERTVRNRVARMVADEGLRFSASLGGGATPQITYLFLLKAKAGRKIQLSGDLQSRGENCRLLTGDWDLMVTREFPDHLEATRFLDEVLHQDDRVAQIASAFELPTSDFRKILDLDRLDIRELMRGLSLADIASDEASALDWLLREASELFLADHSSLVWYPHIRQGTHSDEPRAVKAFLHRLPKEYMSEIRERFETSPQMSLIEQAAMTHETIVIDDIHSPVASRAATLLRTDLYSSLITLPIIVQGQVHGVYTLYYDDAIQVSEGYLNFAESLLLLFVQPSMRATQPEDSRAQD